MAGFFFFAHQADHVRRGADEFNMAGLADFGKIGILAEQSITGMNGINISNLSGADHRRNIQIALC